MVTPLVTPDTVPGCPDTARGEMEGDLVARGDRAGEKEGDMAVLESPNISWLRGERACMAGACTWRGGREVMMGGTGPAATPLTCPASSLRAEIS